MEGLRKELDFAPGVKPGPLLSEVFDKLEDVPGFFTYDDVTHFVLLLRMQSAMGVSGDVLEIGAYYGRSAALLAYALEPGEQLTICDPLVADEHYAYPEPLTESVLRRTIATVNPDLDQRLVKIVQASSRELQLHANQTFRFVHIDGGHQVDDAVQDLNLAARHLCRHGIIAMDDYQHPDWPEVTQAVDKFLEATDEFTTLADLNRHTEAGRKLYLIREGEPRSGDRDEP